MADPRLTKSDVERLCELADHGPAVRNAGKGWKLNGWNRRAEGMDKLVRLGFARKVGEGRKEQIYISEGGRIQIAQGGANA